MIDNLLYFFIGLLFIFIICVAAFIVVILHYFACDHSKDNYSIFSVDINKIFYLMGDYHNRLINEFSDLDDKLDDLLIKYSYLERRLFEPDYISVCNTALSEPLEKVLVEILKDIEKIKNSLK